MAFSKYFYGVILLCQVSFPASEAATTCREVTVNNTYSCEGLGLTEVPESLPFTTETLDFSFNILSALYSFTFSSLGKLVYLDLTRCQINWVFEEAFQSNPNLQTIVLVGNQLMYLADTAFAGPISLKHLFLTQTGLTCLMFVPMHNLDDLETLDIGSNPISAMQLPDSFPIKNLRYLDFQLNGIENILAKDVEILRQVTNLSLSLKGNSIKYIEPKAFYSNNFFSLNFAGCANMVDISVILAGLMGVSTHILKLGTFEDVHGVSEITSNMLQGLCNISVAELSLENMNFNDFSASTFQCMTRLQKLDLTRSNINFFPPDIENMSLLTELILNQNKFNNLCDINLASFSFLTHLHVNRNFESLQMGSGCLVKLLQLQYLDLSDSGIKSSNCCSSELKGLSNLKHLNLSNNDMLSLQDLAFPENSKLEILDFSCTHLQTSKSPFVNLQLLRALNLSQTSIDTNNQHLLQGLPNLTILDFKENRFLFDTIQNDNLFQFVPNLEVLILSSCELKFIGHQAFHMLKKLKHVDLSYNSLTTFSSNAFINTMYLNFAVNSIQIIPQEMVNNIPDNSIINLSHNPLDCSCSNIGFISWYKQNINKIEDPEDTMCGTPRAVEGTKLSALMISCGMSTEVILIIVLIVLLLIIATIFVIKCFLKKRYLSI
ncbi:CD180 antigen [Microcaecilia unicolor]|uniref:CD180 antigen n=1 Tax=Microcaecilia unicolor TaxID=1415580 RepID=A0A6P7X9A1_9AMPH|nr:CD180 antigen [Microcaecilia unicolor]